MMLRRSFMALAAGAAVSSRTIAAGGTGEEIFHVAIFRFTKENLEQAVAAFRALTVATRQEPGNIAYDVYRGIDDDLEFYIVEHWASAAALAAHERTEAFIHYGRQVLAPHATLHDTVTGRPFA
jgi:quinol monooxygenase YgiN